MGLMAFSFPYCDARKELSDIYVEYYKLVNWNIENIEQSKKLRNVCVRFFENQWNCKQVSSVVTFTSQNYIDTQT